MLIRCYKLLFLCILTPSNFRWMCQNPHATNYIILQENTLLLDQRRRSIVQRQYVHQLRQPIYFHVQFLPFRVISRHIHHHWRLWQRIRSNKRWQNALQTERRNAKTRESRRQHRRLEGKRMLRRKVRRRPWTFLQSRNAPFQEQQN